MVLCCEGGRQREESTVLGAAQSLGSRDCLDHFLFLKVGGGVLLYKEMLKQIFKTGLMATLWQSHFTLRYAHVHILRVNFVSAPYWHLQPQYPSTVEWIKSLGHIHKTGYDKTMTMSKLLLHATWMNLKWYWWTKILTKWNAHCVAPFTFNVKKITEKQKTQSKLWFKCLEKRKWRLGESMRGHLWCP